MKLEKTHQRWVLIFFLIIQVIFSIEEKQIYHLFSLYLSIFLHNLHFIGLSYSPLLMLSMSEIVNVFVKWHVCTVIAPLFLHTNLTDLIKYTKHPYVLFHFELSQRIYIDNTEQVYFQHCLTRSILQIIESENNTKIENC